MHNYTSQFIPARELSPPDAERMLALYESLYVLPNREIFWKDLAAKNEVLLLRSSGELVGFTTVQIYDFHFHGIRRNIVFSGDTVVHRDHWGQQVLARSWITRIGQLQRQEPNVPIYWFLVVKGHRTYRFLPAFCTRFFPHWEQSTPELKALADALAEDHFGSHYDASSGLIRYPESRGHLKAAIAQPTEAERRLPAVAYFLERNPGYLQGHEMVCLFEFTEAAMRPLTQRLFRSGG